MSRYVFEEPNFLGDRLRFLRESYDFTQQDVADVLGISRAAYTYYESGTTRPDPASLGKLARLYDLPVEVFYQEGLESELGLRIADPGRRKRTSRVGKQVDPQKIGELWPVERKLILLLRTNGKVSADTVMKHLREYLDRQEKKEET